MLYYSPDILFGSWKLLYKRDAYMQVNSDNNFHTVLLLFQNSTIYTRKSTFFADCCLEPKVTWQVLQLEKVFAGRQQPKRRNDHIALTFVFEKLSI